jgi:hypothetical protein
MFIILYQEFYKRMVKMAMARRVSTKRTQSSF